MQTTYIEHEIRSFLVNQFLFGRDEELKDDTPLLSGVVDSSGVVEMVLFLQEQFSITVEDDEVANSGNFESLKGVVAFVERKLARGSQPPAVGQLDD